MFLSLGGSRRVSSSGVTRGQGNLVSQVFKQADMRRLPVDSLQAVVCDEHANFRSSSSTNSTLPKPFQSCCKDPTLISSSNDSAPYIAIHGAYSPSQSFVTSGVSRSPLQEPYSPSLSLLSRESKTILGATGEEELLSRSCMRLKEAENLRPSRTIALAKKLKHFLGDKFPDTLRGMIDAVVKQGVGVDEIKQDGIPGANAWSEQLQPLEEQIATSRVKCLEVEKNAAITHTGAVIGTTRENSPISPAVQRSYNCEDFAPLRSRNSLKRSFSGSEKHATAMGWLPQQNLSQLREAMAAELSCKSESKQRLDAPRSSWNAGSSTQVVCTSPNNSVNSRFYTPTHSSSLEPNGGDMNLDGVPFKEPGSKGCWRDPFPGSRLPSTRPTVTRKHVFPEAAAMGTCFDFRPRTNSYRAVSEGRSKQSDLHSRISRSLLGFQNSSSLANPTPQFSTDSEKLYQLPAADPLCYVTVRNVVTDSWQESYDMVREATINSYNLSGYDYCCGEGGVKETLESDSSVKEQSMRQCIDTTSILNVLPPIEDDGGIESDSIALARIENFLSDFSTAGARDIYSATSELLGDFTEVE